MIDGTYPNFLVKTNIKTNWKKLGTLKGTKISKTIFPINLLSTTFEIRDLRLIINCEICEPTICLTIVSRTTKRTINRVL